MRLKNFFDSIAFRISITIAVVIAATTIAIGWMIIREEKRTLEMELKSKGIYLTELMAHHIEEPLLYEERHAIFSLLQDSMKSKESLVVYAEVYDKNKELIVSAYKNERYSKLMLMPYKDSLDSINIQEDSNWPVYYISLPIEVEPLGTIGFLRMCITKEFLYSTLEAVKQKLYLLAAAVISLDGKKDTETGPCP